MIEKDSEKEQLEGYLSDRSTCKTEEERMARFRDVAQTFGPADEKTQEYRAGLQRLGIDAVISHGSLGPDEILQILESEEVKGILLDPSRWE